MRIVRDDYTALRNFYGVKRLFVRFCQKEFDEWYERKIWEENNLMIIGRGRSCRIKSLMLTPVIHCFYHPILVGVHTQVRNMDVWKQDWYSMNANIDCGDNPDMVPIWAGQQGMQRAVISGFRQERRN